MNLGVLDSRRNPTTSSSSLIANTAIGDMADEITDKAALAAILNINEEYILFFTKRWNNVYAYIATKYSIPSGAFTSKKVSFYRDEDGSCLSLGSSVFTKALNDPYYNNLKEVYFPAVAEIGDLCFRRNYAVERIYLPNCLTYGGSNSDVFDFVSTGILYVHASMETINGGGVQSDIAEAQSNGVDVRFISDSTAPSKIFDLSITESYDSAFGIDFTPVISTNTVEIYNVFIDGMFYTSINKPLYYIAGLKPETTFSIQISVSDSFYNSSILSKPVSASTNSIYIDEGAAEIFSFRRKRREAVYACEVKRSTDNALTKIYLPYEMGAFISLNSMTTSGQTLGDWIGSSDGIINTIYGQIGFKDLNYTSSNFKLITAGVLQKINGRPALNQAGVYTGNGLEALGINGGARLTNASVLSVWQNNGGGSETVAPTFGNDRVTSGLNKDKWMGAGDMSVRFYGASLLGSLAVTTNLIRASFKNGDTYSDYINGKENIAPSTVSGTSIRDDFYISNDLRGSCSFKFSEVIIFLSDERITKKELIMADQNQAYKIY